MSKAATKKIEVLSSEVRIVAINSQDYICLTDIARYKGKATTDDLIRNWLRNRNTVEFLGLWEQINNSGFNPVEFDGIKMQAGLNSFTLTPKQWIERTGAIGIQSKTGRYGGTYAHADIAFEFAAWISVEFKLYLIKEFQRLKETERQTLGWDIRRNLAKINYRINKVWFYQLDPDRNLGKTNPLNDRDLAEFVQLQKTFADSPKSWSVGADSIDPQNWDLSVKNPHGGEAVALRSPQEIMEEIAALDVESAEVLGKIRELV
jgi:hypothetical protein